MRNVRVEVAYDGSQFYGWQRQDGFSSVQGTLEEGLASLLDQVITVQGAGRTDTGVHGLRQVAHFHVETRLDDDRLRHALNAHLRPGVVVNRLESCRDDFHSRFDARGKRYMYLTLTRRFRPPIGRDHAHWINQALDLGAMREAAQVLVGEHDFKAFGNSGSERKTTVRRIHGVRLLAHRDRFLVIVQGNGFLYNMVRTICGSLIQVGLGKMSSEQVRAALATGDRELAGPTAPACGLYLQRVLYSEPVFQGRDVGPQGTPGMFPV